ncbi:pyridoxal phosphate homeostasis protein-like isoform X2 [Uloborus diversus]|uniref:pyridoxal phosphate homeostasis protein-like isoform X2 n=1 Tax=Uloborus diversus TaxID=327109 RepID=UPI00240A3D30|nr:pyridoxal phosphate homeostasis protein-like isoform X2 [Uloborus diversus]
MSCVAAEIAAGNCREEAETASGAEVTHRLANNMDSDVHLIAVSKTKPVSLIREAYSCGQRDFGENYVNELCTKATHSEILEFCPDIRWHFIGHLQSNKVNKLLGVPNLHCVHSVHSSKLANLLDRAWGALHKEEPLKIMIEVNVSREPNKDGCTEEEVLEIFPHILANNKNLSIIGLMLIGYAHHDLTVGPNPDMERMVSLRNDVCEVVSMRNDAHKVNLIPKDIGLSMGMSHDFEHAITLGSTYVRVGTLIFGDRKKE